MNEKVKTSYFLFKELSSVTFSNCYYFKNYLLLCNHLLIIVTILFRRMIEMKKKSLLAGIMSACILSSAAVAATAAAGAPNDIVYGDANCNGTLELSDAILIMQSLANPSKYGVGGEDQNHLTDQGRINGDVYERGGGLTANDALAIQKRLLNLIPSLPESYAPGYSETTTQTTMPQTTTTTTTTEPIVTVPKEDVETKIHLTGSSATVEGKYAVANGSNVTISHSGSYYIDGTLNNGQIYVEVPDDKADPAVAAQAARDLIDNKEAVALVGSGSLLDCAVNAVN